MYACSLSLSLLTLTRNRRTKKNMTSRRLSETIEWDGLIGKIGESEVDSTEKTEIKVLLLLSNRCVAAVVGQSGVYNITPSIPIATGATKALAFSTPMRGVAATAYGPLQWDFELGGYRCHSIKQN